MWWGKRISFESLQNTILSPAMWLLKQQMLMRLVFVTLFQNSNPKGTKKEKREKDLISYCEEGELGKKKRRKVGMNAAILEKFVP